MRPHCSRTCFVSQHDFVHDRETSVARVSRHLLESEVSQFRSYRTAAARLHARLSPFSSHEFRAHLFRENEADAAELIPEKDFLAILVAFRIVFAERSPTQFGRICNLAWKVGDDEIRRLVQVVRHGWKESFASPIQVILHEQALDSATILNAWMNGEVFHQDDALTRSVELIRYEGALSLMLLQFSVWMASFTAVSLDGICSLVLDEPTLPLLSPASTFPIAPAGQPHAG